MTSIVRKGLFSIGEWINGWNVFERLDQFREMERWDTGRIREFKLDNLKQLAHSAYAHVPLYRQLWDKAGVHPDDIRDLNDLFRFPRVTRKMIREAGDLALDVRYPKKKLRKVQTTGTTGESITIYKDKEHQSWFIAGVFLGWEWAGCEPGDRILRLDISKNTRLKGRIEDRIFNWKRVRSSEFNEAFYKSFTEQAISFRPIMIRTNPIILYHLAQHLLKEGISDLRPRVINSTACPLYPPHREVIEKAFGCPVLDTYGAAEMIIAHQCEEGSYHILPSGHVEVDTERQEFGDTGPQRLLLTSLTNRAMPLIRYDIADMGNMGTGMCACGRTWECLSTIYGRETDIIPTPSGNYLYYLHFFKLFNSFEGIDQYQIEQKDISKVSIYLVTNRHYDKNLHEPMITHYLTEVGGPGLNIEIKYVDSIPIPPSGKYRYIISHVKDTLPSQRF
jgi:phenylacetate-CoA ligase